MQRFFILFCLFPFVISSCDSSSPVPSATPTLTETATPTCTPTPTFIPTETAAPTITPSPTPPSVQYNQQFLSALPSSEDSCLPDKTKDDLGIYIYDLTRSHEVVSINADVPFQFASAFKGPVLVYFLSQCRKYWDTESAEWNEYFVNLEEARNIPYYTSPEYKTLLVKQFADVRNWNNIEAFFNANRVMTNGVSGAIDKRYFVLNDVYVMTARSNNPATGEVLQFIFENCAPVEAQIEPGESCDQPNAISAFNRWFDSFAGISYQKDEPRRGLFKWDVVMERGLDGQSSEVKMRTYGVQDQCVTQSARLNCSADFGSNAWTARDLFKFYDSLSRFDEPRLRNAALAMLSIDEASPARGFLKNLARRIGASSMSKNGHAHFIHGSINSDAGIFSYQDTAFVIVVLGYDAQGSLSLLYGDYSSKGEPLNEQSLIRDLIVEYVNGQ